MLLKLLVYGNLICFEKLKPEKLRTDKGTEFLNESFQQYLKKKNIHFYTANNEPNASVVERVNRTLKSKLYCYIRTVNSLHIIYVLQGLVYSYDNTYDRSIEHAPATNKTIDLNSALLQKTDHGILA